jgi:hypothetical protein
MVAAAEGVVNGVAGRRGTVVARRLFGGRSCGIWAVALPLLLVGWHAQPVAAARTPVLAHFDHFWGGAGSVFDDAVAV